MWDTLRTLLSGSKSAAPVAVVADPVVVKIVDPNSANPNRPDLVETTVNSLDEAKDAAMWLTKGVGRNQPAVAVALKDCTDDHLSNILLNKPNLSADYRRVIEALLTDRGVAIPVAPPTPVAAPAPVQPFDPNAPVDDLNKIV